MCAIFGEGAEKSLVPPPSHVSLDGLPAAREIRSFFSGLERRDATRRRACAAQRKRSSHDDRYYAILEPAFVYYVRTREGRNLLFDSRYVHAIPSSFSSSSFFVPRSRIAYFHVFHLDRHCTAGTRGRATLFIAHQPLPTAFDPLFRFVSIPPRISFLSSY